MFRLRKKLPSTDYIDYIDLMTLLNKKGKMVLLTIDEELSRLDRRDRTYTHTLFLIEKIIPEAKRLGKPLIFDLRRIG